MLHPVKRRREIERERVLWGGERHREGEGRNFLSRECPLPLPQLRKRREGGGGGQKVASTRECIDGGEQGREARAIIGIGETVHWRERVCIERRGDNSTADKVHSDCRKF